MGTAAKQGARRRWALLHGSAVRADQALPLFEVRRCGTVLHGSACGRSEPVLASVHAMRTDSGRPSSSMRFSTPTAMATSVACRPSVCERSVSPITRYHPFVAADCRLDQGAEVVAGRLLPSHAAMLGDGLQMPVALRRRGLGRLAEHGGRAWRHDDCRLGMARGDDAVNTLL